MEDSTLTQPCNPQESWGETDAQSPGLPAEAQSDAAQGSVGSLARLLSKEKMGVLLIIILKSNTVQCDRIEQNRIEYDAIEYNAKWYGMT